MLVLILGLVIFLGVHSAQIVAPGWRSRQMARTGEGAWKAIYTVASLVGLALIVWGYGLAREDGRVQLWDPPVWTVHLNYLLMLPIFVLLVAPYFPGRIKVALKHPMLVAVKLWAVGHLLANGDLASLVLFGSFLAWAVAARISAKRRSAPVRLPGAPPSPYNDLLAILIGLALYVAFVLWLHGALIGVPLWRM